MAVEGTAETIGYNNLGLRRYSPASRNSNNLKIIFITVSECLLTHLRIILQHLFYLFKQQQLALSISLLLAITQCVQVVIGENLSLIHI